MAKDRLRIVRTVPGAGRLARIVARFCLPGDGILTAFSDARLHAARMSLPADSAVQVLPFGELVSWSLSLCGLGTHALAQRGLAEAAVMEACLALEADSPLYLSAGFKGLHRRVAACLGDLRAWQLEYQELEEIAQATENPLAAKLHSLATVGRDASDILEQLGRTSNDAQIARCLDATPPADVRLGRIMVVAGSDFSPSDVDWLLWAAKAGADVTVVTECHGASAPLFEGARLIENRLGVGAKPVKDGCGLATHLFGTGATKEAPIHVAIQSASDPLAEAEWALRGCLEDLGECVPQHRVGIFARDLETYAPLLLASAARLGVGLAMSRRGPLLGNGFARLVLASLQFCASDDVRTLLPVLRSSYVSLSREVAADMSSHVREACRDRAGQWQALMDLACRPESPIPWLAALLRWRESAIVEPTDLAGWKGLLEKMMVEAFVEEEASERIRSDIRRRDVNAQTVLRRAIAQCAGVHRVRSNPTMDLAQFVGTCERLWQVEQMSIPAAEGGVPVFQSGDAIEELDSLYVLGMLEGMFPRRRAEDPILNDADLAAISERLSGRPPLPTSHDRARAERDEFFRVCMSVSQKLTFSYPLTEEDRDNVPAFYLTEIERALGGAVIKRNLPRGRLTPDAGKCIAPRDAALAEALAGPRADPPANELATEVAKDPIRSSEGGSLTPNQIRDVLECPFRFVVRHRLKLDPGRSTNRWGLLSRLPQAVGLWAVEGRERAVEALEQALDAEIETHYAETSPWERTLLRLGGKRVIGEWVDREFAARDTWPRRQGSLRLNARFGEEPLSADLPATGGGRIRLEGVVPAVSRIGDYWVAHVSQVRKPSQPRGGALQEDSDVLQLGIPMMALFDRRGGVGVEVESMRGGRTLFTLFQGDEPPPLVGDAQAGLSVVRLGKPSEYMPAVKLMLADALRRLERVAVETTPGEYCAWCDAGELCRRSREFGEDDSPFGEDE